MTQKKRNPSFDAMIKFFLEQYNIATKQDINRLAKKIEQLEKSVLKLAGSRAGAGRKSRSRSASDNVLNVIVEMGNGATFSDLKAQTDYDDKKLRNIIYRLTKQGKIKRKQRGMYIPA